MMEAFPPQPLSQNRVCQNGRRKQYQSCDHCRKGRRACDAVLRGIDPFRLDNSANEILRKACSTCQKSGKACTFKWLRQVPDKCLPQGLKRKLDASHQIFPHKKRDHNLLTSDKLVTTLPLQMPQSNNHPIVFDDSDFFELGLETQYQDFQQFPREHSTTSRQSDPGPAWDHQLEAFQMIQADNQAFDFLQVQGFTSHLNGETPAFMEEAQDESFPVAHDSARSSLSFNNADFDGTSGSSQTPLTEERIDSVAMTSGINLEMSTLWSPSSKSPSHNDYTICELEAPFDDEAREAPSASSEFTTQSSSTGRVSSQGDETVNMHESRLAQCTSKYMITGGLMQIYNDSMENALACWVTEQYCPYESRNSSLKELTGSKISPSLCSTTSLYRRVHQLDRAFLPLRKNCLTVTQNAGASRALKLAIMAFASQWSHSPQAQCSKTPSQAIYSSGFPESSVTTLDSDFRNEITNSFEFECLLRQSLWNEAQRCIHRWAGCDSFRLILAEMIFSLVQRPLDEEGLEELQEAEWAGSEPPQLGHSELLAREICNGIGSGSRIPAANSIREISHTRYSTSSQCWRKLADVERRTKYLDNALGHLRAWRTRMQSFLRQKPTEYQSIGQRSLTMAQRTALQARSSFNILFWLGVMCDTTASVLTQRPLILSDEDTALQLDSDGAALSSEMPKSRRIRKNAPTGDFHRETDPALNLWGPYLMDLQGPCIDPFQVRGPRFSELAENILQKAIPVKVLLWRKVGSLQGLLSRPTSPAEFESCISEALRVYQHWNSHYGEFMQNCIAEHPNLPFKIQSWYVILAGHWHLACLLLAGCIDQIDEQSKSENLQRALRRSSALVLELEKANAYAIASLARVSCSNDSNNFRETINEQFHFAVGHGALLTEPWTDVLNQALATACEKLLDWLRCWRYSPIPASPQHAWVYSNNNYCEVTQHCASCIDALILLGRKSDVANLTAIALGRQLNLLEEHESHPLPSYQQGLQGVVF